MSRSECVDSATATGTACRGSPILAETLILTGTSARCCRQTRSPRDSTSPGGRGGAGPADRLCFVPELSSGNSHLVEADPQQRQDDGCGRPRGQPAARSRGRCPRSRCTRPRRRAMVKGDRGLRCGGTTTSTSATPRRPTPARPATDRWVADEAGGLCPLADLAWVCSLRATPGRAGKYGVNPEHGRLHSDVVQNACSSRHRTALRRSCCRSSWAVSRSWLDGRDMFGTLADACPWQP